MTNIENITLQISKLDISNNDNMIIEDVINTQINAKDNELIHKFSSMCISNSGTGTDYNIKLSNMLYSKDEIEISFITKLLTYEELDHTDLENEMHMKEILYWINEYFKSDFKSDSKTEFNSTFSLLFKVYYDFYSVLNPKFYQFIYTKYEICKTNDFNYELCFPYINDIVYNMSLMYKDCNVFMMRQFYNNHKCFDNFNIGKIYRKTKNNSWLDCYDKIFHNLLLSIYKNDIYNITYYLLYYLNNIVCYDSKYDDLYDALYYVLIKYYTNILNIPVINLKNIDEKWLLQKEIFETIYDNVFHYYLTFIIFMNTNEELINNEKFYYVVEDVYNDFIYDTFENTTHINSYNLLKEKRYYEINDYCSCFVLERNNYDYETYKNIILTNYLYFTKSNNYNLQNIYNHNGVIDDIALEIKFNEEYDEQYEDNEHEDDEHEEYDAEDNETENMNIDSNFDLFHNNYNYELDEQPLIVQNKSLKYINVGPKYDLEYWLTHTFPHFNKKPYLKTNKLFNISFKINY